MKKMFRKWIYRFLATLVFIAGILITLVLQPTLTYANKTTHNNFRIYHNKTLNVGLLKQLDTCIGLLQKSEYYRPNLQLDICLNDGSLYPTIIEKIQRPAFAWGFYNKVVLNGEIDYTNNLLVLGDYKWNLQQLLTHEMIHCLQYDRLGLWKSNPLASIPEWKWEGYAEYIARQANDQKDLVKNLDRLFKTDSTEWSILFSDGSIIPRIYYQYWVLVQYCMDIRKMSFTDLLKDTVSEESKRKAMMDWYKTAISSTSP